MLSKSLTPYSGRVIVRMVLVTLLLLFQTWYEWSNFDPVGRFLLTIVSFGGMSIILRFVCSPIMLRKMEEKMAVRDGEQDEW